jgi:predicted O-methyltransferase YrrM|uniref:Methyltransferase n=1 Tax=viral metagenome TaxID=1070528 RepID=A0A6C0BE66_9ZZZZ
MKITLDVGVLNDIDLSHLNKYVSWTQSCEYFEKAAGQEYYRLIAHIVSQMPQDSKFVDIGTYYGLSACALGYNSSCPIVTYDIFDHITDNKDSLTIKNMPNVEYRLKDCILDDEILENANLIVLDVDPHDGVQEKDIINKLVEVGFNGILILDDINLNDNMKAFWNDITQTKYDISKYGHWSGTGIVFFSAEHEIELL